MACGRATRKPLQPDLLELKLDLLRLQPDLLELKLDLLRLQPDLSELKLDLLRFRSDPLAIQPGPSRMRRVTPLRYGETENVAGPSRVVSPLS